MRRVAIKLILEFCEVKSIIPELTYSFPEEIPSELMLIVEFSSRIRFPSEYKDPNPIIEELLENFAPFSNSSSPKIELY